MSRIVTNLRYDLPLHFVLLITNWLPDNVIFYRLRGTFSKPFFGTCGKDLRLGRNLSFHNPKNIHLGSNIYIAFGCSFIANDTITIENEVIFGPYCVLASGNHTSNGNSFRYGKIHLAPIKIESGCWICSHTVVTAGSSIGAGSLIAAGAVVTKNIAPNNLVGGVPAHLIKEIKDREPDAD